MAKLMRPPAEALIDDQVVVTQTTEHNFHAILQPSGKEIHPYTMSIEVVRDPALMALKNPRNWDDWVESNVFLRATWEWGEGNELTRRFKVVSDG